MFSGLTNTQTDILTQRPAAEKSQKKKRKKKSWHSGPGTFYTTFVFLCIKTRGIPCRQLYATALAGALLHFFKSD